MKITFTLPHEATAAELREEIYFVAEVLDQIFSQDSTTPVAVDVELPKINVKVDPNRAGTTYIPPYTINNDNVLLKSDN